MPDTKAIHYRIVELAQARKPDERARGDRAASPPRPPASRRSISTTSWAARSTARSAGCPSTTRRAPRAAIFRDASRARSPQAVGQGRQFVDLGAGDCCKAQAWLPFLSPARYIAVDIAAAEIERALARMAPDFPEIEMVGVVTDFSRGLRPRRACSTSAPATFFYPGSSIGNFAPEEALRASSRSIRALLRAAPRQRAADRRGRQEGAYASSMPPTTTRSA